MKKLLIILLLISQYGVCQNDFLLESYERPIISVNVNGKTLYMLIDTGSSLNVLDIDVLDKVGAEKRFRMNRIVTLGADREIWHLRSAYVFVKSRPVTQFISTDIMAIRESILQETGIKIGGILGAPAIKELCMSIDLKRGIITFKD